ncbi:MAG: hypothetical protein WBM35_17095 [Candidatus Electrothrix sp.]
MRSAELTGVQLMGATMQEAYMWNTKLDDAAREYAQKNGAVFRKKAPVKECDD